MRIRAKLLSAFVAVALFTGALGWYAVQTIEHLNQGQRTTYGDVYYGTHLLATWVDLSWEARSALLTDLVSQDPAIWSRARGEMARLDARLGDIAEQMDQADTDREDVETQANLNAAWGAYVAWRDREVITPLERGDQAAALEAYRSQGAQLTAQVDQTIDAFLQKKREVGSNLQVAAEASYEQTRGIAILLSGAAVLLGLWIGHFMSRSIARSAVQMAKAAKGLAVGDLDQEVEIRARDEIGELGEAFKEMIAYQRDMARVADAMARGDLGQSVRPKAASDRLGTAFGRMIGNLRTLVAQLEDTARRANTLAELAEEREARIRAVMDSVADAIITFDPHAGGSIDAFNPTAERLFGYTAAEVVGKDVRLLLGAARELLLVGTHLEIAGRRRDGTTFPIELAVSEMRLADRRLLIASIRDISERKQAEAAQRFLGEATALLAASLDYETSLASVARLSVPFIADTCAIHIVQEDGKVQPLVVIGAQGESDRAWPSGVNHLPEHVARTCLPVVWTHHAPDDAPLGVAPTVLTQVGVTALMLVPMLVRGRALGVLSFAAAGPHRRYGRRDRELAEELAHRCALAIENARLYREAQNAIRLRDDFFSVASHELKTPVAALMAFTQFMRKRAERRGGLTTAQITEALSEVHWQSDRIARLVGQLLDTSRLDAGKLPLEPEMADLTEMVEAAVHAARNNTRGHTLNVQATGPVWARVDALRLEQVITNLLDNAIKYSPEGGVIDVEVAAGPDSTARVSVRDRGIGIPPEHRPHIFDRFYQAHAGQHFAGVAGMGLGLYISRRIVEMHGGRIELEAPEDGGCRVTVTLPRHLGTEDEYRPHHSESADAIA